MEGTNEKERDLKKKFLSLICQSRYVTFSELADILPQSLFAELARAEIERDFSGIYKDKYIERNKKVRNARANWGLLRKRK